MCTDLTTFLYLRANDCGHDARGPTTLGKCPYLEL